MPPWHRGQRHSSLIDNTSSILPMLNHPSSQLHLELPDVLVPNTKTWLAAALLQQHPESIQNILTWVILSKWIWLDVDVLRQEFRLVDIESAADLTLGTLNDWLADWLEIAGWWPVRVACSSSLNFWICINARARLRTTSVPWLAACSLSDPWHYSQHCVVICLPTWYASVYQCRAWRIEARL